MIWFGGRTGRGQMGPHPTSHGGRAPGGSGLAPTTLIATTCGPVPADHLRPGDAILTRDNGYRALLWAGQSRRAAGTAGGRSPVAIEPGRLGPGQPERWLNLAAGHGLLVDAMPILGVLGTHEALAPAGAFGRMPARRPRVGFVHLLFDAHELVNADGAWVETLAPEAAFRVFPLRAIALKNRLLSGAPAPLRPWIEPADLGLSLGAIAHRVA